MNKKQKVHTAIKKKARAVKLTKYKQKACIIHILSLIPLVVHQAIATLDMPAGVTERGAKAKEISDAAAVSTYLTIPPAVITALNTLITAYNAAGPASRASAYNKMLKGLKSLMATFQTAADLNVDNAIALIKSAKFGVKTVAIRQKQKFSAKNGAESGVVDLTAQGGGAYTCHDWFHSNDGITFVRMAPTVAARTSMSGLTPEKYAYFTHELVTKKGGQGVSQIIRIIVK